MKKILAIIFLLCANYVFAQDTTATAPIDTAEKILLVVETMPVFPGGLDSLMSFLKNNTIYPDSARNAGIEGKVYVAFVVNKEGWVQDVRVIRGVSPLLNEEAIRVVKLMPRWSPGYQEGKAVNVQYTLPMNFKLTDPKDKK